MFTLGLIYPYLRHHPNPSSSLKHSLVLLFQGFSHPELTAHCFSLQRLHNYHRNKEPCRQLRSLTMRWMSPSPNALPQLAGFPALHTLNLDLRGDWEETGSEQRWQPRKGSTAFVPDLCLGPTTHSQYNPIHPNLNKMSLQSGHHFSGTVMNN